MCNREWCSYARGNRRLESLPKRAKMWCLLHGKSETGFEDCPEQSLPINSGGPSAEEPTRAKEKRKSIKQEGNRGVKRKFLTLKENIEVIEYANKNPSVGGRDLAAKFSCRKSQINSIITSKKFLLER